MKRIGLFSIAFPFSVTEKYILAIIKSLDSNKSNGSNNISIKMIKICRALLALPLKTIFEAALSDDDFPDDWKKGEIGWLEEYCTCS